MHLPGGANAVSALVYSTFNLRYDISYTVNVLPLPMNGDIFVCDTGA